MYSVFQIGPLRCWPGGLCLSRSIGDTDVGEFIVPVPHVKQVKVSHYSLVSYDWNLIGNFHERRVDHVCFQLSDAGGRLIIASDGIWDALSSEAAAKACRGLPADLAAKLVVKVRQLKQLIFWLSKWRQFSLTFLECWTGSFEIKGS